MRVLQQEVSGIVEELSRWTVRQRRLAAFAGRSRTAMLWLALMRDGARSMSCASALPRKRRIRLVQGSTPWRVENGQRGAAQRLRSSLSAQCDAFA